MAVASFGGRLKAGAQDLRLLCGHVLSWPRRVAGMVDVLRTSPPVGLVIAPQDIRTIDPTLAPELQAGRYTFCGKTVHTDKGSIFDITPPSAEWAAELHGFGWLRHLRGGGPRNGLVARTHVEQWIARAGRHPAAVWQVDVTARRLLSWLSQSPLILGEADDAAYRRFMRCVWKQVRWLRRMLPVAQDGQERMLALIALVQAGLSIEGQERMARGFLAALERELECQILADGGHISRNGEMILTLLLELLPLRQAAIARGMAPSPALTAAMERMMPMLRFLRHGDGSLALFNGMGATPGDHIATIIAYDEAHEALALSMPQSGYERMALGRGLVLMDAGLPPPPRYSRTAHAGALSFEFSWDAQRLIVNCGMAPVGRAAWQVIGRETKAHSTLCIDGHPSAALVRGRGGRGSVLVDGPCSIEVRREQMPDGSMVVEAVHDGYVRAFGVRHQRRLGLQHDGMWLTGEDRLLLPEGRDAGQQIVRLHFHLHPSVRLGPGLVEGALMLHAGAQQWQFVAGAGTISAADSVYLASIEGARATRQIIVEGPMADMLVCEWSLQRLA